jgi:predicted RNase H-like HicB family nuclease
MAMSRGILEKELFKDERVAYSMTKEFNVVIERDDEGWLIASVPQLRGCHTQARSLDELMTRIEEAARLCLEVQGDVDSDVSFVGLQRLAIEV